MSAKTAVQHLVNGVIPYAAAPKAKQASPAAADPLAALQKWAVTEEQISTMKATILIWRDLIARSHLAAWPAPPNGGKTTMAKLAASELAGDYRVLYFQEDASAGDLPAMFEHANKYGYTLLNSTLASSSTEQQIKVLRDLSRQTADLSSVVMFFDTLKKYVDLMSKGGSRAFFQLMRALTQRGATIVLLGHTNKHRGADGKLIFEGVGDVRSDVDEMIYLEATDKDPNGLVMLTMRPDKVRCAVRESSFSLDTRTMEITPLAQVVDVRSIREADEHRTEDQPLIDVIDRLLAVNGGLAHTDLVNSAKEASGESRSRVQQVVNRYASATRQGGALWAETRLAANNNMRRISRWPAAT